MFGQRCKWQIFRHNYSIVFLFLKKKEKDKSHFLIAISSQIKMWRLSVSLPSSADDHGSRSRLRTARPPGAWLSARADKKKRWPYIKQQLELETEFLFSIPDPTAPPGDRQERRPARQTDEGNIWLQNRSDGDKGAAA